MLGRTEPRTGRHCGDGAHAGSASLPAGQRTPLAAAERPRRSAAAGAPPPHRSPVSLPGRDKAAHRQRHGARWFTRRRLLASASLLACGLTLFSLVTGTTFGRFRASETGGTNSVTAGTVTLADSAIAHCPVSNMLPGSTPGACTFTATYSGSASVYLAVDVLVETQAGSGGTKLYNPGDSGNDLQVTITSSSPTVTYTVPTAATTCPGAAPSGSSCYELDNEFVSTIAVTSAAVTFSVAVSLPAGSATGYQDGAAQIILTTHAVQSKNNTLSCSAAPVAGSPCTPSGSFKWS